MIWNQEYFLSKLLHVDFKIKSNKTYHKLCAFVSIELTEVWENAFPVMYD